MKGKGKAKGKGKRSSNIDDIMNNIDMGGYGDEDMDDGMGDFEKNFDPEKQFNMPIYDNIDKEFDKFGNNKKYFVRTYGCQMNEHDSEKICGMLESVGYKEVDDRYCYIKYLCN